MNQMEPVFLHGKSAFGYIQYTANARNWKEAVMSELSSNFSKF
jgi:hypothetical protein